jgi:hypothetical protein
MTNSAANESNLVLHKPLYGHTVRDCCFLAVTTILSSIFYISRIGFYWDDWLVLKIFHFSHDQSVIGLTRSVFAEWPEMKVRPLQAFQWAVLYPLFGQTPLGYHIVSTAALLAGVCMFYLVLRTLTQRRLLSLATAVLYGLLPHYSTDRIWYAIWAANLSMVLYFLSLYADLNQLSFRSWIWPWKVVASLSLMLSLLAYEPFMPFFLLNPVLVALKRWQLQRHGKKVLWSWAGTAVSYITNMFLIIVISKYKQGTSRRAPGGGAFGWWLVDNTWMGSIDLTFRAYGSRLPHILSTIWNLYWSWSSFAIALAMVIVVAGYLMQTATTSGERLPRAYVFVLLIATGTLIAGGSYSYLYSFYEVNTGVNNRVVIAAGATVAIAWVSIAGLLCRLLAPEKSASHIFSVLVALLCGCGCLINNTVASFWAEGSQKQRAILSDMKEHFSAPPPGSSIVLTGLCAWNGPGIVFEATWDAGSALALLYDDKTLRGEPLWPWAEAREHGIPSGRDTSDKTTLYSYSSLYLYDVRKKEAGRITDAASASSYIAQAKQYNTANGGCLTAGFGTGLPIW